MIQYIDVQLAVWGKWRLREENNGRGFPKVSPMFRECRSGNVYGSKVPFGIEEYAPDTDAAVARCTTEQQLLARQRYVVGGKSCDVMKRMCLSKPTFHRRVDELHAAVKMHLEDMEIERHDVEAAQRAVNRFRSIVLTP